MKTLIKIGLAALVGAMGMWMLMQTRGVEAQTIQPSCTTLENAVIRLQGPVFNELPVWQGVKAVNGGTIKFTVLSSADEAGTWTILFTRPDGCTRIAAFGNGWEHTPDVIPFREAEDPA